MTAVEVCPICDIAGCRHIRERKAKMNRQTDEELDALAKRAGDAPLDDKDNCFICYEAAIAITALRTQLAEVQEELSRRVDMHECAMAERDDATLYGVEQKARADRAEAALADADAMIEAQAKDHAENNIRLAETSYRANRAEAALAAQIEADARIAEDAWLDGVPVAEISAAIRSQPHDRSALAKYREKVLQEAADELKDQGYNTAVSQILALINKENVI